MGPLTVVIIVLSATIWIVLSVVVAAIAKRARIDPWLVFVICLVFTPFLGAYIAPLLPRRSE